MKSVRTKFLVLTLAALAASGCSIFKKGAPKTPVVGERVAVLATEQDVAVDPATAALDSYCRSYDHANLFVVDASFFPSSAAVNPALTIAAQALRAADHMLRTDLKVVAA